MPISILDFQLRIEKFLPCKRFSVFICSLIVKNRYQSHSSFIAASDVLCSDG